MPDTLNRFSHLILIIVFQQDSSLPFCRDIHLLVQSQRASQATGDTEPPSAGPLWLPLLHMVTGFPPIPETARSPLPVPALAPCSVLQTPRRSRSCFPFPRLPRSQPATCSHFFDFQGCLDFPVSTLWEASEVRNGGKSTSLTS